MDLRYNKIEVYKLKNGMILGEPIYDEHGEIVLHDGVPLDDHYIEYLKEHQIESILIYSNSYLKSLNESDSSKRVTEQSRKDDLNTIQLNTAVKKRIGEGVDYLFNNAESENFLTVLGNITDTLTNAVIRNNAIAIDVDSLKTSDEYTFKHSVDVASLAMIIGKSYGLKDEEVREIGIAGLLHDMGKSKIPLQILNKPAKLTEEEFELIKEHSLMGYQILEHTGGFSNRVLEAVLKHHEKLNGRGYPFGVTDESIPLYAKILSVSDVYDALVTERPYKKGFLKRDAIEIIMSMSGELDLNVVHAFLKSIILYPVDSIVQLSDGSFAKVLENYIDYPLRPKVVNIESGVVYDLKNDLKCQNLVIV